MSPRTISILGATGSIGHTTLAVIREHRDKFRVKGLAAHSSVGDLAMLAEEFQPEILVLADETKLPFLNHRLKNWQGQIAVGSRSLDDLAACEQDLVVAAITGIDGLSSTCAALAAGNQVCLANKESLVCAGPMLMQMARKSGKEILPLDSEHSAIFQCLKGESRRYLKSITLTASGGPFRGLKRQDLAGVTPSQALAHPSWHMGAKVSIDSATLFNKGLEYIEAAHLFDVCTDKLEVIVHPQSRIHSYISFEDGSSLAQMAISDMKIPVSHALAYPERIRIQVPDMLLETLTFEPVDHETFPGLRLAIQAFEQSDVAPIVLNAANEVAVARFLGGQIEFLQIAETVDTLLSCDFGSHASSLEEIHDIDRRVRQKTNIVLK